MRFWPCLADHAQALNGKLYVMGGGWNLIGPGPAPFALAGVLELDWDEANRPYRLEIDLVTEDGRPVQIPGPTGELPVHIGMDVEAGRPAGVRAGTPLNVPIAINIGALPIAPDARYSWVFRINGETHDMWRLPFAARAVPAQPGPAH
jgi:hypothetical protein